MVDMNFCRNLDKIINHGKIKLFPRIEKSGLTHFMPLISFDTIWKQKTRGFLMFSGGIKRDQCHEMG